MKAILQKKASKMFMNSTPGTVHICIQVFAQIQTRN